MIGKLDAARAQIECAIRLVASGEDDLAIHTLTMAAFGVLEPLARGRGFYEEGLKSEFAKFGRERLWNTANFLKHADRDPGGQIEAFEPRENDWRIGFCLLLYRTINGALTPTMAAFHFWMMVRHPDEFLLEEEEDPDIEQTYREAISLQEAYGRATETLLLNVLLQFFAEGIISPQAGLRRKPAAEACGLKQCASSGASAL